MRRLLTILLVIGLLTALCAPAFALDGDDCFEDVTSDNYYHNAVRHLRGGAATRRRWRLLRGQRQHEHENQ